MEISPEEIQKLLNTADKEDRYYFGKRPSLKEIAKSIENFRIFQAQKLLAGSRVNMIDVCIDGFKIIGYNGFTIMSNAKPTAYERDVIDMGDGLNYIYIKKIFVHPDFRGTGISKKFVESDLELAKRLGKPTIIDVEKDHYRMANILSASGFQEDFQWMTKKGMRMARYFHE